MRHQCRTPLSLLVTLMLLAACGDLEKAKSSARSYAKDLGYEVVGVSCTGTDSDGDGYVACSVRIKEQAQPLGLECSRGDFSLTEGCKLAPTMKVQGGSRFGQ